MARYFNSAVKLLYNAAMPVCHCISAVLCFRNIQTFWDHCTNQKFESLLCVAVTYFHRINYLLAGGLHPIGFHVLNVALHCVISVLMIDVFAILIGGLVHDGRGAKLNLSPKASYLAALFFAAHPVHTESVSRVGRRDSAGLLCPVNNLWLQCSISQCPLMLHEIYITRSVEKKASHSWCELLRWTLQSAVAINIYWTLTLPCHGCVRAVCQCSGICSLIRFRKTGPRPGGGEVLRDHWLGPTGWIKEGGPRIPARADCRSVMSTASCLHR